MDAEGIALSIEAQRHVAILANRGFFLCHGAPAAATRLASTAQSIEEKYTSVPSFEGLRRGSFTKAPGAP